jgi:FlaA1/EpsC-like NDP-sugar epimerase
MGLSKRLCEHLVAAYAGAAGNRTRYAAVRFGNVYGSRGSVVPLFLSQIARGGPITVTDPAMTRYFMSIPEAVHLILHAACMVERQATYVLDMGEPVNILQMAERLIRLCGLRPERDIPIVITGLRPGEKLHETLTAVGEELASTIHPQISCIGGETPLPDVERWLDAVRALVGCPPQTAHDLRAALAALSAREVPAP